MEIVWILRGPDAGSFANVPKAEALKMQAEGLAQIWDGGTPLQFPENHPDVLAGRIAMNGPVPVVAPDAEKPKRRRGRPRKYDDKMMTAENE